MAGCYAIFHKQLGDLVLLEPTLRKLRDHYGDPVLLATRGGHEDLVQLMPGIRVAPPLLIAPIQAAYCFDPLSKSALKAFLAPTRNKQLIAPNRFELKWYHSFIFPPLSNPELGNDYVAEFFWKNTPVPSLAQFSPPRLLHPPAEWAPKGWKPGGHVLINPTSGWRSKMWTVTGWAQVAGMFAGDRLVLTNGGSDWQQEHCQQISALTGIPVVSTSLKEFLWMCANARLVLGVDGSASHLAASFHVPCFTLFGPTHASNWHLRRPRQVAYQPTPDANGERKLKKVNPEPVLEAIGHFLREI